VKEMITYRLRAYTSIRNCVEEWTANEKEFAFAKHAAFLNNLEVWVDDRWVLVSK